MKLCHSLSWMLTERWLNCRDMPISHISVIFQSHFTSLSGTVSSCGRWFSPTACRTKLCQRDGEMQDVLCQCVGELYKIVSLSATACCTYCQRNDELYNVSARRQVVKLFVTGRRLVVQSILSAWRRIVRNTAPRTYLLRPRVFSWSEGRNNHMQSKSNNHYPPLLLKIIKITCGNKQFMSHCIFML